MTKQSLTQDRIYSYSIGMVTTVHLPPDLLESVDRRAQDLGVSRNRFIIRTLAKAIEEDIAWSSAFLDSLRSAAADTASHEEVEELLRIISSRRSSKMPPKL